MFSILPKTTALVAEYLISSLASIVISYFRAKRRTWKQIIQLGEYETCLEFPRDNPYIKDRLTNACFGGNKEIVELMIVFGYTNWDNGLYGACRGGHKELIDLMIEYGANRFDEGISGACVGGHEELAKTMFSLGEYKIPLYDACRGGNQKIVDFAISNGSTIFNNGLCGACRGGRLELVKFMISKGAEITSYTFENACRGGNPEIVKLLMSHNVEITSNAYWSAGRSGNMDVIKMIGKNNPTNLMHIIFGACKSGNVDVIKRLLPDKIDQANLNECLISACQGNSLDVVKLFISLGATNFNYGLEESCRLQYRETAALMIAHGATKCSICVRPIKYHR